MRMRGSKRRSAGPSAPAGMTDDTRNHTRARVRLTRRRRETDSNPRSRFEIATVLGFGLRLSPLNCSHSAERASSLARATEGSNPSPSSAELDPYIVANDLPKIEALKRLFPDLYNATPVLVAATAPRS